MKLHLDRRRILAVGVLFPVLAQAQASGPAEGTDFKLVLPPQPVESGNKVEVLEFFQYGCPHCFAFNPDLDVWRKLCDPVDIREGLSGQLVDCRL